MLRSSGRFWLGFQSLLLKFLSPRLIALIDSMAQGNFSVRTSSNGHWSGAWSSTSGWGMRSTKGNGPTRNQKLLRIDSSIRRGVRYFLWHLDVAGNYNLFDVSCYRRFWLARTGELSDDPSAPRRAFATASAAVAVPRIERRFLRNRKRGC